MPATARRHSDIIKALTLLAPRIPFYDAEQIREAAAAPHLRNLTAENAVRLSLLAYIRHNYTDYEQYREEGLDKDSALYMIHQQMSEKLTQWHAGALLTDINYSE